MIAYGLDIKAPTTMPNDDGWRPVMVNELARMTFASLEALFAFEDALRRTNATLATRVVEIHDDQPSARL